MRERWCLLLTVLSVFLAASCSHTSAPSDTPAHTRSAGTTAPRKVPPLETLLRKASGGDPSAEHTLAQKYRSGTGVPADSYKSLYWDRRAAEHGNADAQFDVASDYCDGDGVPKDLVACVQWMQRAAHAGLPKAQLWMGTVTWNGNQSAGVPKNRTSAIAWFRSAADGGNAYAQMLMSQCYQNGFGCPKDTQMAASLYAKGIAHASGDELFEMGDCFAYGESVCSKDPKAAFGLYKQAVTKDPQLNWKLGDCYAYGFQPCKKDLEKAASLYDTAAAHGNAQLQDKLGHDYEVGVPVRPNFSKAVEWFQQAAAGGDVDAMVSLANLLQEGEKFWKTIGKFNLGALTAASHQFDPTRNPQKALALYRRAAALGSADAYEGLANLYGDGNGVIQDFVKEDALRRQAAARGNFEAQQDLALYYYRGMDGYNQNFVLAYAWADVAAGGSNTPDHNTLAKSLRDALQDRLSPAQLAEAQRFAASWKLGVGHLRDTGTTSTATAKVAERPVIASTGTSFIVSLDGFAITNAHVVQGCSRLGADGHGGSLRVVVADAKDDLALLKLPWRTSAALDLASSPKITQGATVVVFGYPLFGVLASGGNVTTGVVSATTGIANDAAQFQITAPIQPGSSGSPVMDQHGDVVGVVSSKLSDRAMARATGEVGESVNFAVSGYALRAFLDANHVQYGVGHALWFGRKKSLVDITDSARQAAFVVDCFK